MIFLLLLLFVPISLLLHFVFHANPGWVFVTAALAIVPMAEYIRQATEQISRRLNPAIGGLLNVTFGNMPELIIALFVLNSGNSDIVKGQITGAIIGNGLLGLGLSILVGTWGRESQTFSSRQAARLGSLLVLSMIALMVPAFFDISEKRVFHHADAGPDSMRVSVGVSIVLLIVYLANLVYTLVTHKGVFSREDQEECEPASWSLGKSLAILVAASVGTALMSEVLSDAVEPAALKWGFSPLFLGIIALAIIGNAAEYVSAVYFARVGQLGQSMRITVGSSIQLALFVAPLLVLLSQALRHPMNLVFDNPLELVAIAAVVFAVNSIVEDGETTWFEGLLLIAVYALFVLAFYFART
jgi:Ca2+:H+ antiporter